MFTFTNTTVINSDVDQLSGLAKFSAKGNVFKVLRAGNFEKEAVKSVHKRVGYNAVPSKVVFNLTSTANSADVYRIQLSLRQQGNATSVFANAASAHNIKLINIEFMGNSSTTTAANNLLEAVKAYQRQLYPFIKGSVSGSTVTITAIDEYVMIDKAELQKLTSAPTSVYPDDQNQYVKVAAGVVTNGTEGFGTYTNLMKNLRLPTLEQVRFASPTREELPVIGALYDQFTIEYCKERGIMGGDAVGDKVTSITHHVFFVNKALSKAFEQAMKDATLVVTEVTNEDDPEPAKPVVAIPANQSVDKNGSKLLVFTVDGVEKLSGGVWQATSGTDQSKAKFDGNVITMTSGTTDNLMVKVTYNGVASAPTKVTISGIA